MANVPTAFSSLAPRCISMVLEKPAVVRRRDVGLIPPRPTGGPLNSSLTCGRLSGSVRPSRFIEGGDPWEDRRLLGCQQGGQWCSSFRC